MADGHTNPYVLDRGTLTSQELKEEILVPYVRLFCGSHGPDLIFMDDDARPLRAQLEDECHQSKDIQRLEWLVMFHALNAIKHVWNVFGCSISDRPVPRTIVEKNSLVQE
ncbi:DDE_3 domain-containing protein [Trichonephila clavipes]|nr:DDE_3 domain-containing protein [Trichonephila clavipes]